MSKTPISKTLEVMVYSGASGFYGAVAVGELLSHYFQKATSVYAELAKEPIITEKVYQTAMEASKVAAGDYYFAIATGAVAGLFAGLALLRAHYKD
ncbi:hypothetical protein C4573_04610 [Candidatus Woesearchaeota archaeon]|nr:MAG: hypothetical protein C4573_04610 [Candidatus Woesearchaeota archaeon]